jgi:16S rRNA (guanine966-N2)-methyltransferase
MRISGGKIRGHRIEVPAISDLRPSQDKVRQAIFNILGDISGLLVLDLYAGTGVIGIEALSHGARFVDFVDRSPEACKVIEKNLRHGDLKEQGDIYKETAENFVLKEARQPYDLIFLDPPYADHPRSVIRLLPNFLAEDGVIIYLHGKQIVLTEETDREWASSNLDVIDRRRYGATFVTFLRKKDPSSETINPSAD